MVDAAVPARQLDSKTASPLAGWDLIVYIDNYCRTGDKILPLAALARQKDGLERIARLATFFTAASAILRASRNGSLQPAGATGAPLPKPVRATPASRSTFRTGPKP